MRILLIGDIVGKPGRRVVRSVLGDLRRDQHLDLVIANGENAADGSGITPRIYRGLIESGVDCVTLGDHAYRRSEIFPVLAREENIVVPANFPAESPGKGWTMVRTPTGHNVAVFNLLGRVYMRPVDCPFAAAERILKELPSAATVKILDFHAEATSDKQLMGRFLDGRVSAVLGTHTHVPTADSRVLPGGTAFQCDVGMTGPFESILGRRIDRVMETTIHFRPTPFEVATEDVRMCGAIVDVDPNSGKATKIERVEIREES